VGGPSTRALEESATAREGVEALLRITVRFLSRPGKAQGCFLVRGAINGASANKGAPPTAWSWPNAAPHRSNIARAIGTANTIT